MNNNKFKQTVKRIIYGFVAAATAITVFPAHFAMAEEVGRYPYTLFAASSEEGAITVNAGNFCVNGNVATNGTIASSGNMNINGTKTENAGLDMIYVFDKIDSRYFLGTNVDEHSEDYTLDEINININEPTEVYGEAELTGNININTALKAFEDITLNGEVKNTNDSVIFSKYGDIVIDSANVNLNGLVYAPFGSVNVKAMNLNLNNVVIIADSIILDCPNVNANYSTNAADFVGTISEPLNISKDEWQYMKDENGNGLPDFFENFENWSKLADTDGDDLPDSIEEYLGSDSNNIDTDGDGLGDYYEVFVTYTDPTMADTDENGVSDADEDFDEDNLTNFEEFINKTNPYIDDMDNDGLSDGDEIKVYGTDPLVADTDGDELEDGDEIILGTNPLVQDTDGDGIIDSKEKFQQTFTHKVKNEDCAVTEVIVDMECTGNIKRTTTVESIMGVDYLCSEVVGLVGEPFEIETTSEFDKATLTFRLNTERIETGLDNLMFLWYDEDNRVFRNINTSYDVENSTVTIETTHFSKYMVVDSTEWFEVWKNALVYDSEMAGGYSNIDTVLALDFSGSMSYSEKVMAKQAALSYVETMKPGDRTAIETYGIRANAIIGLTNDVDALKACLNGYLSSDGGTSFNSAVNVSAKALSGSTASKKIIILMSDGQSTISNSTLNALDSDIVIHTIGLRTGSYSLALSEIASKTGGKYYKAATASDLIDIYSNIGLTNSYIGEDTDKDGIADIFEISGMMLTNGNIIITDPLKADTDGDMLVDGDEITIIRNFKELVTESYPVPKYTYVFDIKSNPHSGDYDDSGVSDYDEANGTEFYGKSYYVSSLNGDIINIPVGTVAYGYPNTSCGEAFIAKEVNQDFQYHASALIYANGEYWIKVFSQNEYDVWGYIKYSDIMPSKRVDLIIEKHKKYNMNLDFHNFYPSGHAYNERNVFIDNPEYQGFLMALADVYPGTSKYNELGYVLDGFVLIGICFGESNAGAYNRTNLFGSTQGISEETYVYGKKTVIDAMICCGIASSIFEAEKIIQNDDNNFYVQAAKMIGHLEIGLTFDKIDLSANYTSYCTAYANAANWRNCYKAHIFEREDYAFYYYSKQQLLNLLDEKIISICSIITERE